MVILQFEVIDSTYSKFRLPVEKSGAVYLRRLIGSTTDHNRLLCFLL